MSNWNHYNGQNQGYNPHQQPQQPPYQGGGQGYGYYSQAPLSHLQQHPQYIPQPQPQFQQHYQQNYQPPLFNFEAPAHYDQWMLPQQAPQPMPPQMFQHHQQQQQQQPPLIPFRSVPILQPVSAPSPSPALYIPRSQQHRASSSAPSSAPSEQPAVQRKPAVDKPKSTGPSTHVLKEQALIDLSNRFYDHAVSQRDKITTEKNVQEYFTLIKLAIVALQQVIKMKHKASLKLRIKCSIRIAEILSNEADLSSLRETPGVFLDEAVLLCGDVPELAKLKYQAEVALVQDMISQNKFKQALKTIAGSKFNDTFMFKFLKFTVQKSLDPLQAHQTITQLIQSCKTSAPKETLQFIQLTEISHCLTFGLSQLSNFDDISPQLQDLIIYKHLLIVLYEIQYKASIKGNSTLDVTSSLKLINDLVTQRRQSKMYPGPIELSFPFNGKDMTLEVHMFDPLRLYITFYVIFAVSGMNSTFEKRKSQKVLQMASNEVSGALESSGPRTLLKDYQELSKSLQEMSTLLSFFFFIESSIVDEAGEDASKRAANAVYTQCSDPILLNYVMALGYHLRGEVDSAMKSYMSLAAEMEETSSMYKYNDLYITICLNLSAVIESQVSHYSGVQNVTRVSELMNLRSQVNDKLEKIRSAPNTAFHQKYLFDTTLEFLEILYNPSSVSIFEIIERIDKILIDQERLKSYPLLLSMLLYIKSSTLNNNSDQKQKSSQSAFNLAKMGYSPLIRYVTGTLNQQNAALARNDQQLEIQKQKLIKVENKIRFKFANMFQ